MKPYNNKIQSNDTTAPPVQPQVFPTNPSLANLCNMLQNSMPMQQPQLGIINPYIPISLNNSNTPNFPPLLTQQPGFINPQMGFSHLNTIPMFMNQVNQFQHQGQPYALNFPNLPQSMGFPNLQNLMHNQNPVLPIQMPIPSLAVGPQNSNFFANPSIMVGQQANPNQPNFVEDKRTQQIQRNLPAMPQTQKSNSSGTFRRQGNPVNNGQNSTSSPNWKNFPSKDFKKNPNKEASKLGYQKSQQFHNTNNGKRKFGFSNVHKGKGYGYERPTKCARTNPTEQAREKKRPLALTYTEQEIKQWCEERRKNYPSKANINKKCSERQTNTGFGKKEAKQRREQLKEILAKQAELGVEVAEIPSHYLSDSEKQVNERENNKRSVARKGRSQNKHDRKGRYNKNDGFGKQQKLVNKDSSSISSFNKRKPTLLHKLLSADVKRDKHHLLQAFRFMVMNSFFEDWPEKPLKFPHVVKEDERVDGVIAEKSSLAGKDVSEVGNKTSVKNCGHACDKDEEEEDNSRGDDGDKHDEREEQKTCYTEGKLSFVEEIVRTEEEEGEIID